MIFFNLSKVCFTYSIYSLSSLLLFLLFARITFYCTAVLWFIYLFSCKWAFRYLLSWTVMLCTFLNMSPRENWWSFFMYPRMELVGCRVDPSPAQLDFTKLLCRVVVPMHTLTSRPWGFLFLQHLVLLDFLPLLVRCVWTAGPSHLSFNPGELESYVLFIMVFQALRTAPGT